MKTFIIFLIICLNWSGVLSRKSRETNIVSANSKFYNQMSIQTILQQSIAQSVEMAVKHCQHEFYWDRWNCPVADFLAKRTTPNIDREAAFVQSITMAALIYTVAKNCSRGVTKQCACNSFQQQSLENELWASDCTDEIEFSEQVSNSLFQQTNNPEMHLDAHEYAHFHNNEAARIAVRNSIRKHCRCHGLSGSCAMQTCWRSLNSFSEIAAEIRKMYDRSVLLTYNNKGKIDTNIGEDSLVFVIDSPNYCKENAIAGWSGTVGRKCSRNKGNDVSGRERKSCRYLCRSCGLRVHKQQVIYTKRCNCKFNWCCNVTCDNCQEHVEEYSCY